jgi:acyl-CoA synthetase (AMP-forming)/AMP-acid ligase II
MLLDIPASIAGDAVALSTDGGRWSYDELRARVARVAGLLAERGLGPGDRVGVMAVNRPELVELVFGAAAHGVTLVPMNYRARADEAGHLVADSGARLVFADHRYADLLDAVHPPSVDTILLDDPADYTAARDAAEPDWDLADVDDDDVAVLLYTSGTTSLPKGVMLTHGALTGYVMGANDAADGDDHGVSLLAAPLYHVAGLTSLLNALWTGRRTHLLPQFEPATWLRAVEAERVTHAFLVPTMLAHLLDAPGLAGADLSSLENITYGAAPMPPAVIRRAVDAFPSRIGFAGSYGQTETTATVAVLGPDDHRVEGDDEARAAKLRRLASVGRPVDDVEARVVDPLGNPLDAGEVGEVQLRTARAMRGYWGSDERTRVTIDDEGWVHTGDLGFFDDGGYLFLAGRANDLIIRGGENIAPEEVEAVLYEHPDVVEAAAAGVPDEEWGERVFAAAVVRDGSSCTEADLTAFCAERLPGSKRPERVLVLEDLPRTSTGKVVRRRLVPVLEGLLNRR